MGRDEPHRIFDSLLPALLDRVRNVNNERNYHANNRRDVF